MSSLPHVRRLRLVAISLVVMISLVAAPAALARPPAPSPFAGTWDSIDIDGSYQTLQIHSAGASPVHVLKYYDFGASLCGTDAGGAPLYPANGQGVFRRSGDMLAGSLRVRCEGGTPSASGPFPITYTYQPGTDTLLDSMGVIWSRT